MTRNRELVILVLYVVTAIPSKSMSLELCEHGSYPLPLDIGECTPDNCRGKCTSGKNPDGLEFDICCDDTTSFTCFNLANTMDLRNACFNDSALPEITCESFEANVRCAARYYNETVNNCRGQFLKLYHTVFSTKDDFDPENCPCNTSYTKTNQNCPCTDNTDACGIDVGQSGICCFKNSYLQKVSPCSSSEVYFSLSEACTSITCKGRCENVTIGGLTDTHICCMNPEDLKEDDNAPDHQSEKPTPAGPIVGAIVALLVGVAAIAMLTIYLRRKGVCKGFPPKRTNKNKTKYDDIQMQSRENGTFSNVL